MEKSSKSKKRTRNCLNIAEKLLLVWQKTFIFANIYYLCESEIKNADEVVKMIPILLAIECEKGGVMWNLIL